MNSTLHTTLLFNITITKYNENDESKWKTLSGFEPIRKCGASPCQVYSAATKVSKELKEEQPESQSGKGNQAMSTISAVSQHRFN